MKVILETENKDTINVSKLTHNHYVCVSSCDTFFYLIVNSYPLGTISDEAPKYGIMCLNTLTVFKEIQYRNIQDAIDELLSCHGEIGLDVQAFDDIIGYQSWLGKLDFNKWRNRFGCQ